MMCNNVFSRATGDFVEDEEPVFCVDGCGLYLDARFWENCMGGSFVCPECGQTYDEEDRAEELVFAVEDP